MMTSICHRSWLRASTRLDHSSELRSSGTSTAYRCSTARSITSNARALVEASTTGGASSGLVGLKPTLSNHAPAIAGSQTRKAVLGHRRDQVIADAPLMLEEFRCHHRAHQMDRLDLVRRCSSRRDRSR